MGFCRLMRIENDLFYGIFTLFAILSVYNGQRILKLQDRKNSPWLDWVKLHKNSIIAITFISFLLSFYFLIQIIHFHQNSLLLLLFSGLISLFYVIKIRGKNLRELPYLKIHLISIVWVLMIILFPVINEQIYHNSIFIIALAHYFYILGVTIPFDIRDYHFDYEYQKTIPQVMGIKNAKYIAVLCLCIFYLLMTALFPLIAFSWLFIFAILIQILLILYSNTTQKDFYFAGFIDGSIALLGLSYLVYY